MWPAATAASAERPRLLLVDDEPVNLLVTSAALEGLGFEVRTAGDGPLALDLALAERPDLVLLDARMPGMDGFETCRQLRQLPGLHEVPVLMITSHVDNEVVDRAFAVGATDFFMRTDTWALLAARLRHMLRAALTQSELQRNRGQLSRALEVARMGTFDWHWTGGRPGLRGFVFSEEAQRLLGGDIMAPLGPRDLLRQVAYGDRHPFLHLLRMRMNRREPLSTELQCVVHGRRRRLYIEAEPEVGDDDQCTGYSGILQDVTERHLAEQSIRRLSYKDTLTLLPNRNQITLRLRRAIEAGLRLGHDVALLVADLDRFKKINETLGHHAGDELLMEVARRFRACVRHSDLFHEVPQDGEGLRGYRRTEGVGRLGGDEFAVLLAEASEEDALRVAQRLHNALRSPVCLDGQEIVVSACIGMALGPRDGTTAESLMQAADAALTAAKRAGRHQTVAHSPSMIQQGRERLALETALHHAIERQELRLHYQPKVSACGTRLVGVEALMRWDRGAAGGLVSPGAFIPLAEESDLIESLTEWALEEAARQAALWRGRCGFGGTVAVNIPSRMFARQDLPALVDGAVERHGIPHSMLALEITESGLMEDLEGILPLLHALHRRGVQISVDDFGTGYSSLKYLSELPISELKIDRSFVINMSGNSRAMAVITSIISLAKALHLKVVAEGVEEVAHVQTLQQLHCDVFQGYFFSRPLPAEELDPWVKAPLPLRLPPDATALSA
ncbi:EAL domain-containing protein [Ideonella sp. TBM-1]|uniref:EAL domain-containing protein n=2 Tax=Ideonella livida TaxID=2707176 RepID=A0A7C9TGR6_9BURK|nr:EAL domain-containing protein [Ideonella livida]